MRKKLTGQSVIEFALALPILLLLIMGVLDFGRAFFMKIALVNAAREGAYFLSYNPADKTKCDLASPPLCYLGTRQAVVKDAYAAGMVVNPANIAITNCCTMGQPVEVRVSSSINLSIFNFLYGPLNLSGSAKMKVLQ